MKNGRRSFADARLRAGCLDELRVHELRTAAHRRLGDPFAQDCLLVLRQHCQVIGLVEAGVPGFQHVHLGKASHLVTVAARTGYCGIPTVAVRQPISAGGEHKGGDETLDIPLPWRGQCFVEIINVKDEPALRRGEAAEIHQVRVTAHLDMDVGGRHAGQVRRHDAGRPTVEREGRLQHAPIAQRHQVLLSRHIRGSKNVERVCATRWRPPGGVRSAWHGVTQLLADGPSFR